MTSEKNLAQKRLVIPGELITHKIKKLHSNVFLDNSKIYSSVIGLVSDYNDNLSVIPLNGTYKPCIGDGILAVVKDEVANGYILEFNSYDDSFLLKSNIRKELKIGTLIFLRIKNIAANDSLEFDNINILPMGRVFETSPVKIPRLIGKNESMLNLFKQFLGGNIVVGKNGWVWYNSPKIFLANKAFSMVVNNSQKSNLTNSLKNFFEKNKSI